MAMKNIQRLVNVQEAQTNTDLKVADALGVDSRQEAALLQTGFRFYQQNRFVEAKNIFEGLAVLDAENAYVHGILGSIHQKNGNNEEAISSYSTAIGLFGKDVSSLVNRGEVFLKLGKFQEAAEDFTMAIRLDPARKNPVSNRARLLVAITQDALKVDIEKNAKKTQGRGKS